MEKQEWSVLDPVAHVQIEGRDGARRFDDYSGKRIGLWWNGKPNGDIFLNEVAAQLEARFEGVTTVRFWEKDPVTTTFYGVPQANLH